MSETVRCAYCVFKKKPDPEIQLLKTQVSMADVEGYLQKIRFYLPQMRPLFQGVEIEYFPRRTLYAFNTPCGMCDYAGLCINGRLEGYIIGYDATAKQYRKPIISPSEIIKYETCPRQWAYSKTGVDTPYRSAIPESGTVMNIAIDEFIVLGVDPEEVFDREWGPKAEDKRLRYNKTDTHASIGRIAKAALRKFVPMWDKWGLQDVVVQGKYMVEFDEFYLKGKPDLKARKDDDTLILDWKFSSSTYTDLWTRVSDQLTAYAALHLLQPAMAA